MINKILFFLTSFLLLFLLLASNLEAVDTGCSSSYPKCLGTTVVDRYKCESPEYKYGKWSCPGASFYYDNSITCNSSCAFIACSSNDLVPAVPRHILLNIVVVV